MDFSTQLDDLQQRATDAKTSAQAAGSDGPGRRARGPCRADGACCVRASASCSLWPGAS